MPWFDINEVISLWRTLLRCVLLGGLIGLLCGGSSALFLTLLEHATHIQETHTYLLFCLPVAGAVLGAVYQRFGKPIEGGNNLLLDKIHQESEAESVPFRLAPMVLLATVWTHLFGGSSGREGTAVQMGGTLASLLQRPLKLDAQEHRLLLICGISGGFSAVFGTPLAGTVFGMEVLALGALRLEALLPCFVAAYVGDLTCRFLGITHHAYSAGAMPALTAGIWGGILLLGALSAGVAALFSLSTEAVGHGIKKLLPHHPFLRPAVGGVLVIVLALGFGREYLGLSLPLLEKAFQPGGVILFAFALKLVFTAVTLGSGFKGGEVTPLFVIGATLGASVATVGHWPVGFFAALGFVAVFAGAANTPLTCALMGIELFGAPMAMPLLAICTLAYLLSGHRGIYLSQRIESPKAPHPRHKPGMALRDWND